MRHRRISRVRSLSRHSEPNSESRIDASATPDPALARADLLTDPPTAFAEPDPGEDSWT
jgi:hypothetical protein